MSIPLFLAEDLQIRSVFNEGRGVGRVSGNMAIHRSGIEIVIEHFSDRTAMLTAVLTEQVHIGEVESPRQVSHLASIFGQLMDLFVVQQLQRVFHRSQKQVTGR